MASGDKDQNKVHASTNEVFHAQVSAKVFWLELGDVRRLLAAADEAGVPDDASFLVYGTSQSMRREEFYIKHAHIRHGQ